MVSSSSSSRAGQAAANTPGQRQHRKRQRPSAIPPWKRKSGMVMPWDQAHEDTRVKLASAHLADKRARATLRKTQMEHDRQDRFHLTAMKKADDARVAESIAQRLLDDASRKSEEARRKNLARHRWEADVHRRKAQLETATRDRRRWEADARRNENSIKELSQEIDDQKEAITERSGDVRRLNRKFQRLRRSGRGLKASVRSSTELNPTQQAASAFSVTDRAISALGDVLESIEAEPGHSLRLVVGEEGNLDSLVKTRFEEVPAL